MEVKKITKQEPYGYTRLIEQVVNHNAEVLESALGRIKELEKCLTKEKPYEKFESAKDHICKLASDYKCWDERLSHDEALELCKILEQEPILDKVRTEIEAQEEWLAEAGYDAYNVGIAFESIKRALGK